jgi:ABC-2 type transport system ATP-binding protein
VGASPAISIDAVSKRFRLYHERPHSLKERVLRLRRTRAEDFWALRDVSFDVGDGETVGLIGANGSGKTTLLKIIGGILRPTGGQVSTRGRIAALLELGAGFHPELTGRENVYLNASILGLSKRDTDLRFDDIVGFAELEPFIDNQVKHYSSGMFVRLGFAVAVHVDPEILLVDEVLAVGDEAFQRKCIARVRRFQEEGRTIVLVTHAVERVREICDRAVMLDRGGIRAAGDVRDVIREFRVVLLQERAPFIRGEATQDIQVLGVALLDQDGRPVKRARPPKPLSIQIDLKANRPVDDPVVSVALYDSADRLVYKVGTDWLDHLLGRVDGTLRLTFDLATMPFVRGRYHLTVGVHARDLGKVYDWHDQRYAFDVDDSAGIEGQVWVPAKLRVEEL